MFAGAANPMSILSSLGYDPGGMVGAAPGSMMPCGPGSPMMPQAPGACPNPLMPGLASMPMGCTQEQMNHWVQLGYQQMMQERMKDALRQQKMQYAQSQALLAYIPHIPLGVEPDDGNPVGAGLPFVATPSPVVPYLATQFTVVDLSNPYFVLDEVKFSRVDLLGGSTGVPAQYFAPNAIHAPLENPEIAAGVPVIVRGRNIDGVPHPFLAAFDGIDKSKPYSRFAC